MEAPLHARSAGAVAAAELPPAAHPAVVPAAAAALHVYQSEQALREADPRAIRAFEQLLGRLTDLAQSLGAVQDIAGICRPLVEFVRASAPCNGLFVSLYHREREEREAIYAWADGVEEDVAVLPRLPINSSPTARAIATGEVVVEHNDRAAIAGPPAIHLGADRNPNPMPSSIAVPMLVRGRVTGAFVVQSVEQDAYAPEHITALRMAASLAAIAIENLRLLERERQAAERSVQAEKFRALGQMASGIAHELSERLAVLTGYNELALNLVARQTSSDEQVRETLHLALGAALDSGTVVRRLVEFGQAPASEVPEQVHLATLLREVAEFTRPRWRGQAQAEERPIRLEVQAPDELTWVVLVAPLRQALTNLVFNAVDALPQGGTIRMSASVEDGQLRLDVTDTGVGMPREVQARAFEPYFTTKPNPGAGLGLTQVMRCAEAHAGEARIASVAGRGTTVSLSLPHPAPVTPPAGASAPSTRGAPLHFLVVDDDGPVRRLLARMLVSLGHAATSAESGEAALEHLQRQVFDVLVADISMSPGMSGWELVRHVRTRWPALPCVITSGWYATINPAELPTHGVAALLPKPFRRRDLEQLVASLPVSSAAASPAAPPATDTPARQPLRRSSWTQARLLADLGRDLILAHDLDHLLELGLRRTAALFGCDSGSIALLGEDRSHLRVLLSTGAGTLDVGSSVEDVDGHPAWRCMRTGLPIALHAYREEPGTNALPHTVWAPLLSASREALGVMVLVIAAERPPLTRDDLRTIEAIAGQLGAAIERAHLQALLEEREQRLQELVGRILLAQEEERRKVAYEVHDGLAQLAAGARHHLEAFTSRLRVRSPELRRDMQRALDLSQQTVREARRVIGGLRPTVLDDFGLARAISTEIETLRGDGWQVDFQANLGGERLPIATEAALYRVAQEALTNVRKHAQARSVRVTLTRSTDTLSLLVKDDGRGFDPTMVQGSGRVGEHLGLASMRERVALLGGTFALASQPGEGTEVRVDVPLKP